MSHGVHLCAPARFIATCEDFLSEKYFIGACSQHPFMMQINDYAKNSVLEFDTKEHCKLANAHAQTASHFKHNND